MNATEIERALGFPPGRTLLALCDLAREIHDKRRADRLGDAFSELGFVLPWLTTKAERAKDAAHPSVPSLLKGPAGWVFRARRGEYLATPPNVLPFATTGLDATHFGFLMSGDQPTDERAIVVVRPDEPDEHTEVIAPRLRDFLSLLAVSFGSELRRSASDAHLFVARKERNLDPEQLERLSSLLCERIPGVVRLPHPSEVVTAHAPVRLTLSVPFSDPRRQELVPSAMERARLAALRAAALFRLGEFERVLELARVGQTHGQSYPRCTLLLASALLRTGRQGEAFAAIDELCAAWLDDAPVQPPALHPRGAIMKDELIECLREADHPDATRLTERIEQAGPTPELEGDFF